MPQTMIVCFATCFRVHARLLSDQLSLAQLGGVDYPLQEQGSPTRHAYARPYLDDPYLRNQRKSKVAGAHGGHVVCYLRGIIDLNQTTAGRTASSGSQAERKVGEPGPGIPASRFRFTRSKRGFKMMRDYRSMITASYILVGSFSGERSSTVHSRSGRLASSRGDVIDRARKVVAPRSARRSIDRHLSRRSRTHWNQAHQRLHSCFTVWSG